MTLKEQLIERGFESNFTPEITDDGRFKEHRDENLGKTSYLYFESPHPKGTVKKFVFTVWKLALPSYECLKETPEKLTKKELSALDSHEKADKARWEEIFEARRVRVSIEAKKLYASLQDPKITPGYLEDRGITKFMQGFRIDPKEVETLYIPIYTKLGEIESLQIIYSSGQKEFMVGGRTAGCYGILHGVGDILYICEGFATAVAIFLATGQSVAFALSAQNLSKAIPNILRDANKDYVVIAADDDLHLPDNPGFSKAFHASKRYGLVLKKPTFKAPNGKETTDFDDLRRIEGIEEVRAQLVLTDKEKMDATIAPSVTALGHREGVYYFTSTENPSIHEFTSIPKETLFNLMALPFWEQRYGEVNMMGNLTVNWDKVASDLKAECHQKGFYTGKNVRGIGVYLDAGRKIIHLGDRLVVDGNLTVLRGIKSKYTYLYKESLPDLSNNPLTDDEVKEFIDMLRLTNLKDQNYSHYICGWMVCSILSGMLEWRPHVYITGERGSGKTQITEIVHRILSLGFKAFYPQGAQSTGVGIRQKLKSDSIPVLMDEVEGDSKKNQMKAEDFMATFRIASSNSEAMTVIGSSDQNAKEFRVGFCGWIAGITPQAKLEQDKSRFTKIHTLNNKKIDPRIRLENWNRVKKYWASIDEEWAKRFVARVINNSEIVFKNIKIMQDALLEIGSVENRFADQHGSLLGASALFFHTNALDRTEVETRKNIIMFETNSSSELEDSNSAMNCLNHILEGKIKNEAGDLVTVWREITKREITDGMRTQLGEYGVLPHEHKGVPGIHIRKTADIARHMRDNPMYEGDFLDILMRLPNAEATRISFLHKRSRGLFIPFTSFLDGDPKRVTGVQF